MKKYIYTLLACLSCFSAHAFPTRTNEHTVKDIDEEVSGDFEAFEWEWSGFDNQLIVFDVRNASFDSAAFRLSFPQDGEVFLDQFYPTNVTVATATATLQVIHVFTQNYAAVKDTVITPAYWTNTITETRNLDFHSNLLSRTVTTNYTIHSPNASNVVTERIAATNEVFNGVGPFTLVPDYGVYTTTWNAVNRTTTYTTNNIRVQQAASTNLLNKINETFDESFSGGDVNFDWYLSGMSTSSLRAVSTATNAKAFIAVPNIPLDTNLKYRIRFQMGATAPGAANQVKTQFGSNPVVTNNCAGCEVTYITNFSGHSGLTFTVPGTNVFIDNVFVQGYVEGETNTVSSGVTNTLAASNKTFKTLEAYYHENTDYLYESNVVQRVTVTVSRTNLPPDGPYFAELLGWTGTFGTPPARSLTKGTVQITHSLYQNTNQSAWVNPTAGSVIGPPVHGLTDATNWPFLVATVTNSHSGTNSVIVNSDGGSNWFWTTSFGGGAGTGVISAVQTENDGTLVNNNTVTMDFRPSIYAVSNAANQSAIMVATNGITDVEIDFATVLTNIGANQVSAEDLIDFKNMGTNIFGGRILVGGNADKQFQPREITGDMSLTETGVLTIDDNKVTAADINFIGDTNSAAGRILIADGTDFESFAMNGGATMNATGFVTVANNSHTHTSNNITDLIYIEVEEGTTPKTDPTRTIAFENTRFTVTDTGGNRAFVDFAADAVREQHVSWSRAGEGISADDLPDFTNMMATNITSGKILIGRLTGARFEPRSVSGDVTHNGTDFIIQDKAVDAGDLDFIDPTPPGNHVIKWNGSLWTNAAESGGGGGSVRVQTNGGLVQATVTNFDFLTPFLVTSVTDEVYINIKDDGITEPMLGAGISVTNFDGFSGGPALSVSSGEVLVAVAGGGRYEGVAMTGDVTINASGVTAVGDNSHTHTVSTITLALPDLTDVDSLDGATNSHYLIHTNGVWTNKLLDLETDPHSVHLDGSQWQASRLALTNYLILPAHTNVGAMPASNNLLYIDTDMGATVEGAALAWRNPSNWDTNFFVVSVANREWPPGNDHIVKWDAASSNWLTEADAGAGGGGVTNIVTDRYPMQIMSATHTNAYGDILALTGTGFTNYISAWALPDVSADAAVEAKTFIPEDLATNVFADMRLYLMVDTGGGTNKVQLKVEGKPGSNTAFNVAYTLEGTNQWTVPSTAWILETVDISLTNADGEIDAGEAYFARITRQSGIAGDTFANEVYLVGADLLVKRWGSAGAGGGATELNDLTNVDTSPSSGEVLEWNGTIWTNAADDGSAVSVMTNGVIHHAAITNLDFDMGPFIITGTAPNADIDVRTDGIDDTHIDFGTGAGQVGIADFTLISNDVAATENHILIGQANSTFHNKAISGGGSLLASGVLNLTNAVDASFFISDEASPTKRGQFSVEGVTTGQVSDLAFPDLDGTIALVNQDQNYAGKHDFQAAEIAIDVQATDVVDAQGELQLFTYATVFTNSYFRYNGANGDLVSVSMYPSDFTNVSDGQVMKYNLATSNIIWAADGGGSSVAVYSNATQISTGATNLTFKAADYMQAYETGADNVNVKVIPDFLETEFTLSDADDNEQKLTFQLQTLTLDRTLTIRNLSGTVPLIEVDNTWSSEQNFDAATLVFPYLDDPLGTTEGSIGIDTSIVNFVGAYIEYKSRIAPGGTNLGDMIVVAMEKADFVQETNDFVIKFDDTNDKLEWRPDDTGSAGDTYSGTHDFSGAILIVENDASLSAGTPGVIGIDTDLTANGISNDVFKYEAIMTDGTTNTMAAVVMEESDFIDVQDQYVPKFIQAEGKVRWTNDVSAASTLNSLTDVNSVNTPGDGHVLTYRTANGWTNEAAAGGGGNVNYIDKSWMASEIPLLNDQIPTLETKNNTRAPVQILSFDNVQSAGTMWSGPLRQSWPKDTVTQTTFIVHGWPNAHPVNATNAVMYRWYYGTNSWTVKTGTVYNANGYDANDYGASPHMDSFVITGPTNGQEWVLQFSNAPTGTVTTMSLTSSWNTALFTIRQEF